MPRASFAQLLGLASLSLSLSCATKGPTTTEPDQVGASTEDASPAFENPGGMWMPGQMREHVEQLSQLGLDYDPLALTDPLQHPLGAVVSLGGCSASFVSPEGLVVTNHHCVGGYLQYNSTPESNLLHDGYVAKTRGEERWGGPTARVYVTTAFRDVTEQVLGGLETVSDPKARFQGIEQRMKDLTASCEEGKDDTRCRVASYFEGAQFFQIEQLEIRDVRLVYAPHEGVGVFGGEVDNWRWPRHTGDWSFLRAYVGKDGKPADYSEDNVPYRPPHHLKMASEPLREGDLVMVAGYPGRTYRHKTADEVRDAAAWFYPRRIALIEQYIAVLEKASAGDEQLKIKTSGTYRGLNNSLTNSRGMLDGLVKGGLVERKAELEREVKEWIQGDPARVKRYDNVFEGMAAISAESRTTRAKESAFSEIRRGSALLGQATMIVRKAQERAKPDAERESGYQQRDWPRLEQRSRRMQRNYAEKTDRAVFKMFLQRAASLPDNERPTEALKAVTGKAAPDEAAIDTALDRLYKKTKLADLDKRIQLLERAKPGTLARSRDPFIQLALALEPQRREINERKERSAGAMAALRPRYIAALREFASGPLAPDANGTLRITYGTVRGYKPEANAPVYTPFTTLTEMVAKHTGEEPFNAPARVLAVTNTAKASPYADEVVGDLPVNFLSDLDITGGNSGSATLNGKGELVGLAFDGNYESMASDWVFMPEITRTIHVDLRYMLWTMDAADGADHLLEELGITPTIANAK